MSEREKDKNLSDEEFDRALQDPQKWVKQWLARIYATRPQYPLDPEVQNYRRKILLRDSEYLELRERYNGANSDEERIRLGVEVRDKRWEILTMDKEVERWGGIKGWPEDW